MQLDCVILIVGGIIPEYQKERSTRMKYIEKDSSGKKERINIPLDKSLFDRLTDRAKELNVSRAELIRLYCENGLERGQEVKPK